MAPSSLFVFATIVAAATALPNWGTTTSSWGQPTTSSTWGHSTTSSTWGQPTTTSTWGTSKTSSAPAPTGTGNNGQQFINQCENFGISIGDCTQLANIAALNGDSIAVGGSGNPSNPVNNGQQFLNDCKNFGISVLDCSQLLNIALLNGDNIDIDLSDLTSLLSSLGLPTGILGPLPTTGLIPLPTGLL